MRPSALLALLLLAGCGGAGPEPTLEDDLGASTGDWQILDLESGEVTPSGVAVPPASHRERRMLFRRLPGAVDDRFIGVCEVTQAQWRRIAGTEPWRSGELEGAVVGDRHPAWDLDRAAVLLALERWNGAHACVLALPSGEEWSQAATPSAVAWEDPGAAAAAAEANVFEAAGPGLREAGGGRRDAFGLYDLRGGLWELTGESADGQAVVRGGSWLDRPEQAAGAARALVAPDIPHPLVGVRLVLIRP